jgi:hypothetical protein
MGPVRARLLGRRNPDGGAGSVRGGDSEPEATALLALALDDDAARAWLEDHAAADGRVGLVAGGAASDRSALAALAMRPGAAREAALDHIVSTFANDIDPNAAPRGWPWTIGSYGWVEPTAWGILALRSLRSTSAARIDDGLTLLRQRECAGGGWNFGTRTVNGVELQPYVQTTALGVLAARGRDDALAVRGARVLRAKWRAEASGLLSLASACAALVAIGDRNGSSLQTALGSHLSLEDPDVDTASLAWAGIALRDEPLEVLTP